MLAIFKYLCHTLKSDKQAQFQRLGCAQPRACCGGEYVCNFSSPKFSGRSRKSAAAPHEALNNMRAHASGHHKIKDANFIEVIDTYQLLFHPALISSKAKHGLDRFNLSWR
jgi:hypothetical protein